MKFLFALVAFCATCSFALDTLEVYAFLVEFKQENPDNSLTTGTGVFDSGEKSSNYSLDPSGRRGTHEYWERHFQFAKSYYEAASNGKQTISWRIFPEDGETSYKLDKGIIDYNRTAKRKDEKVAEYDEARSRDYMTFIFDAVSKANSSKDSPFKVPLSKNPNTRRAYMIIHAGASRLVDGGSLGTNGANTQGDFIDVYVNPDYWTYLPKKLVAEDTTSIDSLHAMPLKDAVIDSLKEIMVVSETASQDGLNWGVNGIIVNQIGRALGMPNTYDVVQGISRLGYFDVMDVAGYNAGNGFFPVLPSAFLRAYMGWVNVKTVTPKAGQKVKVDISAAGSGNGNEIIKVPLSANEYLLIENRERTLNKDGEVDVVVMTSQGDSNVYTIPVDSLSTIFEDSVRVNGKLKKNPKKASGIVLGASSFDVALPASGLIVWKVNEWYLKEGLPYGAANFWGGDTLRDHQNGISLVEADGIVTIGKTFKNALGQDAFDYGSGADMLPHLRYSKTQKFDTVFTIKPTGYGNTATIQGGYTGIKLSASIASDARVEKTSNAFMGDSVVTFAAATIPMTVEFDDMALTEGEFPKSVGLNTPPRAAVLMDYPSGSVREGEKMLVFASKSGVIQAMSAYGEPLIDSYATVNKKVVANKDSVEEVKLHAIGKYTEFGNLIGMAAMHDTVVTLFEQAVVTSALTASMDQLLPVNSGVTFFKKAVAGPIVVNNDVFAIADGAIVRVRPKTYLEIPLKMPDFVPQDMAACGGAENTIWAIAGAKAELVKYGTDGVARRVKLPTSAKGLEQVDTQKFNVVCSDFDRDGAIEAFVLGSLGYGVFVRLDDSLKALDVPRQYDRGINSVAKIHEYSRPIVADVNNDGYPEAVFLGQNKVYAVDYKGIAIAGFPVTISRGTAEEAFWSEPIAVDVTGDGAPEILVPSNGGLVYAYKGNGKAVGGMFPIQAGTFEYMEDSSKVVYPMSIYAGKAIDSLKGLQLYAFHRDNVSAYRLPNAKESTKLNWALPGNGNERTGYYDVSLLKVPEAFKAKDEITEFYMYPNPVRGGIAKSRFNIGANAKYAELEVFSVTGLRLMQLKLENPKQGMNQWDNIDLSKLGFNVYSVRLRVTFESGTTKQKFYRIGVIQ